MDTPEVDLTTTEPDTPVTDVDVESVASSVSRSDVVVISGASNPDRTVARASRAARRLRQKALHTRRLGLLRVAVKRSRERYHGPAWERQQMLVADAYSRRIAAWERRCQEHLELRLMGAEDSVERQRRIRFERLRFRAQLIHGGNDLLWVPPL